MVTFRSPPTFWMPFRVALGDESLCRARLLEGERLFLQTANETAESCERHVIWPMGSAPGAQRTGNWGWSTWALGRGGGCPEARQSRPGLEPREWSGVVCRSGRPRLPRGRPGGLPPELWWRAGPSGPLRTCSLHQARGAGARWDGAGKRSRYSRRGV